MHPNKHITRFLKMTVPAILVAAWLAPCPAVPEARASGDGASAERLDISGEWEIQEDDRTYQASLDGDGNGPYTWQEGHIRTTEIAGRQWHGTWHQKGNDREGGFELLLTEDGREARGVWWYTRVGDRSNIPPRQWGGNYYWKRLPSRLESNAPH